jgi:hypothetical protein
MTQTIINLGTGGALLNGQNGSTALADTGDAEFLEWPGDNAGNYVYLPGVSGNYLSVPDEAALDITGDIDLRVRVAVDDWTPAAITQLIAKYGTVGQYSYALRLNTTGTLQVLYSTNGTTIGAFTQSSVAVSASDGAVLWVRAAIDVDNGSGGADCLYYTSSDGVTWTQLGVTRTVASTISLFAGTDAVTVGSRGTIEPAAGKFYRAQVLDGIDGTTVLDVDTSVISSGSATSFTAATGQTVTINRSTSGRKSVAVVSPVWLFGTDDRMVFPLNDLLEIDADDDASVVVCARTWDDPASSGTFVSKRRSGSGSVGQNAGYWVRNSGASHRRNVFVDDGTTGRSHTNAAGTELAGRLDVFGFTINRSANEFAGYLNGSLMLDPQTVNFGSLRDDAAPFTVGRRSGSNANFNDMELVSVAFFSRALTDVEMAQITAYYQARLS